MKTTIAFLVSVVVLLARACAGETVYLELRCSAVFPSTNYAVPAGRVIQLVDYFGPSSTPEDILGSAIRVRYIRPEGSTYAALGIPSTIVGPCSIEMLWTKELHPTIGIYWATLKEFDAVEAGPSVKLSLEASTNLPNFGPASAYFRTVKAKD